MSVEITPLVDWCMKQRPPVDYQTAFKRCVRGTLPGAVKIAGRWYVKPEATRLEAARPSTQTVRTIRACVIGGRSAGPAETWELTPSLASSLVAAGDAVVVMEPA